MTQADNYFCPGETHPISRAIHLGRLASFYPGCRHCPHRDDTGTLSPRQVRQLKETRPRGEARSVFHDEGAGGVYLNDLGPAVARDIAAAFGRLLLGEDGDKVHNQSGAASSNTIVLAGDGRPITAELVAAVSEGLRLSGCDVADIGPATAACLAFAVEHLQAGGGILAGNPGTEPHIIGLKFWAAGGSPLSAGGSLEPLAQLYQTGVGRPTRAFGALRRFQAERPYLAALASHYHALRPLLVVLDSASLPLTKYLNELTASTACRVVLCRTTREELPKQVCNHGAHFAARIDGDGETCSVLDEQGRPVPAERLLLLLISTVGGDASHQSAIALRSSTTGVTSDRLPDALMTVTLLLELLSRTDDPLSVVLDREAAIE